MSVTMEQIVAHAKHRGFVFPGSEIYGGLANTWDYGPLGTELKTTLSVHGGKVRSTIAVQRRFRCGHFNEPTHVGSIWSFRKLQRSDD